MRVRVGVRGRLGLLACASFVATVASGGPARAARGTASGFTSLPMCSGRRKGRVGVRQQPSGRPISSASPTVAVACAWQRLGISAFFVGRVLLRAWSDCGQLGAR